MQLLHNNKDLFAQNAGVLRVSFDLPEALPYIGYLRKTVRCLIESLGIESPDADEIELLIAELASNAARHAQCKNYLVHLELSDHHVVVTVSDRGVGFSLTNIDAPGTKRTSGAMPGFEDRIGGFGLPLVYALADEVDFLPNEPQGTTVRARKQFRFV